MKKKNLKGFTLVELIVVIAIIGVLAAILVPNMMGYISKSKLSSANTAAKNVQTAIVTYKADQESMGTSVTVANSGVTPTSSDTGEVGAVYTALAGNSNIGYCAWGESGTAPDIIVWAQWCDASGAAVWGQFPNACSDYTAFKDQSGASFGTYYGGTW